MLMECIIIEANGIHTQDLLRVDKPGIKNGMLDCWTMLLR